MIVYDTVQNKYRIAILGCTGYTGIELVNILKDHQFIEIVFLGSDNYDSKSLSEFDKRLENFKFPLIKKIDNLVFKDVDIVFIAFPHIVSQNYIKKHIGKTAHKRLILSHHKNLNRGDYIIDDRTARGVDQFEGEHIHFGQGNFRTWDDVMRYLIGKIET